jgi:Rrf2 family protein
MIILSKLADYGVIVAAHLAADPERQVTAAAVAAATRLPPATVAKILKILAHAGLVTATRGAAGGYRLARGATAISLAEIVAAIDGDIGLTQCSVHTAECARTTIARPGRTGPRSTAPSARRCRRSRSTKWSPRRCSPRLRGSPTAWG